MFQFLTLDDVKLPKNIEGKRSDEDIVRTVLSGPLSTVARRMAAKVMNCCFDSFPDCDDSENSDVPDSDGRGREGSKSFAQVPYKGQMTIASMFSIV